jgi:hypothetical protein
MSDEKEEETILYNGRQMTLKDIERRREGRRQYGRDRWARMTPEERARRRESCQQYYRERLARQTPEESERRRDRDRERVREWRAGINPRRDRAKRKTELANLDGKRGGRRAVSQEIDAGGHRTHPATACENHRTQPRISPATVTRSGGINDQMIDRVRATTATPPAHLHPYNKK